MATQSLKSGKTLHIQPLTGSIGAEARGVDLSREVPEDVAEAIRQAFAEHLVLVFRNENDINEDEQNRLAALFGELQPLQVFQFLGAMQASITFNPGSRIEASNDDNAPKGSAPVQRNDLMALGLAGEFDGWHVDNAFAHFLPKAAVLRADVIAPVGGDTCFAGLTAAYDLLSPMMQEWLADAKAVYLVPDGFKEGINIHQYGPDAEERFDAEYPPREWPLVIAHPVTGRKALFIVPGYVAHIVGLSRPESHAMIRMLCQHVRSASFIYRHHWQKGDLVVWDEVFALHRAPDDFMPHDRKVVRVTAGQQVPTAAS
ncbi:MAG: TauD/TfdA family dioxygenase [Novosphingobium sp.]|nr:TauD/TfdA family dioxygenase [Novosphingobium sp.]